MPPPFIRNEIKKIKGDIFMWEYWALYNSHYKYKEYINKYRNKPVIFIPGMFGSMGDDIIPGTGQWSFGLAKSVYEPFIEMLIDIGYKLNKNFYIVYYDWRKGCSYSAEKYLKPAIEYVKNKTNFLKVNLLCHSMGGIVARAYVQSDYYNDDVDKMIQIATPNAGSVKAYITWAGGEIPQQKGESKIIHNIYDTLLSGYMLILKKKYKMDNLGIIREYIGGIKDLLPSKDYGNYLYYKDRNGEMIFNQYNMMNYKNEFLDSLNEKKDILKERKINITVIAGKGEITPKYLNIAPSNSSKIWADGRVIDSLDTKEGDGTVLVNSVHKIGDDYYTLYDNHQDILLRTKYIIKKKFQVSNSLEED